MAKNPSEQKKKVLRRGSWSPEEDGKLIAYIRRYGIWNWNEIPKYAGLSRSGKSCRLRWLNYLRPCIKRGNITKEEEEIIVNLHKILGNGWAAIAAKLPQRTDNEIKNYWNTRIRKRNDKDINVANFKIHHDQLLAKSDEDHKYVNVVTGDHEAKLQYNNNNNPSVFMDTSLSHSITHDHIPLFSRSCQDAVAVLDQGSDSIALAKQDQDSVTSFETYDGLEVQTPNTGCTGTFCV